MSSVHQKVLAAAVGSVIEFYDFSLYGALGDIMGKAFFPESNTDLQLIKTMMVFGTAFACRPIGGALMGKFGDMFGRRRALIYSVLLMLVPTFFVGCLPTYHEAQGGAIFLLILMRVFQGLAAGGEFGTAIVYTIEISTQESKGYWGGLCIAGGAVGTLLGIGVSAIVRHSVSHEDMVEWGWRIPFLITPVVGLFGYAVRRNLKESEAFEEEAQKSASSGEDINKSQIYRDVFKYHWVAITIGALSLVSWCPTFYLVFTWTPVYLDSIVGVRTYNPWLLNWMNLFLFVLLLPLSGYVMDVLAEKSGSKKKAYIIGYAISVLNFLALSGPAFALLKNDVLSNAVVGYLFLTISLCMVGSITPIFCSDLFPAKFRLTGVGLAYNSSHAVFSSFVPVVATILATEKSLESPGYLLIGLCGVSFISTMFIYYNDHLINKEKAVSVRDDTIISRDVSKTELVNSPIHSEI